jgi:hypothetical protein
MFVRMWGKGTLTHCWWECKLLQLLGKIVWRLLKKVKIELPYDPVFPLLGIYPNVVSQITIKAPHTHVYCSTFHNS